MARFQACLIDVYDTILSCDFSAHRTELPVLAGIAADAMDAEFERLEPALTDGRLSLPEAYARIIRACGTEPEPGLVVSVADKSRELLLASARLYDDVLPFLRTLRAGAVKTAIVSNCDENTRDLLVELGVAALVDVLVLSCEVGAAKPAAEIFRRALDHLDVAAGDAVFVDDQPRYCAGAVALGVNAVQILRDDSNGNVVWDGEVVRSLRDVEAMLLSRAVDTAKLNDWLSPRGETTMLYDRKARPADVLGCRR